VDGDAAEQLAAAVERERIDILVNGLTGDPIAITGRM
jgi:hypothetical protein